MICTDIANDERFHPAWKALGQKHGIEALVSIPAITAEGLSLGTFVITFPPENPPGDSILALGHEVAALVALILTYRRNQLRQELLLGEMQHRVRNLFGTMGALVYATLKAHPEPDDFRKVFDGRLLALARAHSLALESVEADLRDLLADLLAPYAIDHNIQLVGPPIRLTQQAAVAFSLAAHELATNAAKYGSLSRVGGAVDVVWGVEESAAGVRQFKLQWKESGGPRVAAPRHQGYGQRTLTQSIASALDGRVDLDFRPTGLSCSIVAPHSSRLGSLNH